LSANCTLALCTLLGQRRIAAYDPAHSTMTVQMHNLITLVVSIGLITSLAYAQTQTITHANQSIEVAVIDVADPVRAELLHRWIARVIDATRTASGNFALSRTRIEVREIQSKSRSAVPWGQTDRTGEVVKVLLYPRLGVSQQELLADWTATHELAHLYHPYLGRSGRWLAEGFASYQQYRYMARAGVISADQAWRDFDAGLQRGIASMPAKSRTTMADASGTMRIYWAGAAFWLAVDLQLRAQDLDQPIRSLDQLMDRYVQCCIAGDSDGLTPDAFIGNLDRLLADKPLLTPIYRRHKAATTFPDLSASYRTLGLSRDGAALSFRGDNKARQLRNAIMLAADSDH
jgi:hypothetical protein